MSKTLAQLVEIHTGCDVHTEPVFEWSQTLPCSRCGNVTETAMIQDGWAGDARPERICVDCCDAW